MKKSLLLSALFILTATLFSCKREGYSPAIMAATGKQSTANSAAITDAGAAITGKWNVVSDSTSTTGVGASGRAASAKYMGLGTDYFNFSAQGLLYIREGNNLQDTAAYTINQNQLSIAHSAPFHQGVMIVSSTISYNITTINEHNLTLIGNIITPGGASYEYISLTR